MALLHHPDKQTASGAEAAVGVGSGGGVGGVGGG